MFNDLRNLLYAAFITIQHGGINIVSKSPAFSNTVHMSNIG